MHADCCTGGDEIGAVLLSFEGRNLVPLIGWTIDHDSMPFERVFDPSNIKVGNCYDPAARPWDAIRAGNRTRASPAVLAGAARSRSKSSYQT